MKRERILVILLTILTLQELVLAQDTSPKPTGQLATNMLDSTDYWRRTAHGWQWLPPAEPDVKFLQLHPLTVAAFMVLASLWGLLALDRCRRASRTQRKRQLALATKSSEVGGNLFRHRPSSRLRRDIRATVHVWHEPQRHRHREDEASGQNL